jgi:superoxide dismutase, Fe-Mn family
MHRRTFLKWSVGFSALATLEITGWGCSGDHENVSHAIRLPSLPYELNGLEPYLSEETLRYHYGKHHKGYVNNANRLVADTRLEKLSLVEIMREAFQPKACQQNAIFNNAAQIYNHTFYWNSMKPGGGGEPDGLMGEWLNKSFGNYKAFREAFIDAARNRFASGWTWLVPHDGKIDVISTANAETPVVHGIQPLLVLDVWEHAYYLDYKNQREKYIEAFLDHLINWDFAASNLGEA